MKYLRTVLVITLAYQSLFGMENNNSQSKYIPSLLTLCLKKSPEFTDQQLSLLPQELASDAQIIKDIAHETYKTILDNFYSYNVIQKPRTLTFKELEQREQGIFKKRVVLSQRQRSGSKALNEPNFTLKKLLDHARYAAAYLSKEKGTLDYCSETNQSPFSYNTYGQLESIDNTHSYKALALLMQELKELFPKLRVDLTQEFLGQCIKKGDFNTFTFFFDQLPNKKQYLNPTGELAWTAPLFDAIKSNNLKVVQFLLDHGSKITVKSLYDYIPLHKACMQENISPEIISALLNAGADINRQREKYIDGLYEYGGETPLLLATIDNQPAAIIKLLLDAGADPELTTPCHKKPIEYAIKHNNQEVIQLLSNHPQRKAQ